MKEICIYIFCCVLILALLFSLFSNKKDINKNDTEYSKQFTHIYNKNIWGNDNSSLYKGSSGQGSEMSFNIEYIDFLKKLINNLDIESVVDLGCGTFNIGEYIYNDIDIKYHGYDTYSDVVGFLNNKFKHDDKYNFTHLDFFNNRNDIKNADLCILKDVIQHWPTKDIYDFLDYMVNCKKFKYILIVNCNYQSQDNDDTYIGGFRPLSYKMYPLKKYNPKFIFTYNMKDCNLISC